MAEVEFKKTTFNKEEFNKVVGTEFQSFREQQVPVEDSLDQLFTLYRDLYYIIPVEGATDSHEYLIAESSKLFNYERDTSDIQPLLDEITSLREQLLELNQQLIDSQIEQAQNATI